MITEVDDVIYDFREDKHIHEYTKYSTDDLIVEKWVRAPHPSDLPAIMSNKEIIVKPEFYGEWRQLSQEEIDELNAEIMLKNKKVLKASQKDKTKDEIEAELERAYGLLHARLEKLNLLSREDD